MIRICKEGFEILLSIFLLIIVFFSTGFKKLGSFFILFLGFSIYFFRDPERNIKKDDNIIFSAADGIITDIKIVKDPLFFNEDVTCVSIFLSIFDVHVNRSPVKGFIKFIQYKRGNFFPANFSSSSAENEQNAFGITGGPVNVLVKQIAGLIARRIVFNKNIGDNVSQGGKIGMIKFGSRTEILFPKDCIISVKKGQKVFAGITEIAKIK